MPVDADHSRPDGTSDATVEAVGRLSEALEMLEDARGDLYSFHRKIGRTDLTVSDACAKLRSAGHSAMADQIETELVGRNVLQGRWTFQIMEEFDDGYAAAFRKHEQRVRDELMEGRRHGFEAEMKQDRRTHGRPDHAATPSSADGT